MQSFSINILVSAVFSLWIALAFTSKADAFTVGQSPLLTSSPTQQRSTNTRLYFNGDIWSIFRNWGKKATVSHILIGPAASVSGKGMIKTDATKKLLELKEEINDDEEMFAEMAKQYSSCRSSAKLGGAMEPFAAGLMYKTFDQVSFDEEVGKVHGPISTPYGEHLIFVKDRTSGDE